MYVLFVYWIKTWRFVSLQEVAVCNNLLVRSDYMVRYNMCSKTTHVEVAYGVDFNRTN